MSLIKIRWHINDVNTFIFVLIDWRARPKSVSDSPTRPNERTQYGTQRWLIRRTSSAFHWWRGKSAKHTFPFNRYSSIRSILMINNCSRFVDNTKSGIHWLYITGYLKRKREINHDYLNDAAMDRAEEKDLLNNVDGTIDWLHLFAEWFALTGWMKKGKETGVRVMDEIVGIVSKWWHDRTKDTHTYTNTHIGLGMYAIL